VVGICLLSGVCVCLWLLKGAVDNCVCGFFLRGPPWFCGQRCCFTMMEAKHLARRCVLSDGFDHQVVRRCRRLVQSHPTPNPPQPQLHTHTHTHAIPKTTNQPTPHTNTPPHHPKTHKRHPRPTSPPSSAAFSTGPTGPPSRSSPPPRPCPRPKWSPSKRTWRRKPRTSRSCTRCGGSVGGGMGG
jgi:hypothetical protein